MGLQYIIEGGVCYVTSTMLLCAEKWWKKESSEEEDAKAMKPEAII